jgi:hypothetical protein
MDFYMSPDSYTLLYMGAWEASGYDYNIFFNSLYVAGRITKEIRDLMLTMCGITPPAEEAPPPTVIEVPIVTPAEGGIAERLTDYFSSAFREVLKSFWAWLKSTVGEIFEALWKWVQPRLQEAWEWLKAQAQGLTTTIYKGFTQICDSFAPLTPDKVGGLIAALYASAFTAGITAHGVAVTAELLHPLKSLGLHSVAAMVGDFGGYGRLAGATVGVLESKVVGQVTTYALQYKFRPRIHNEMMLQTLAVKGDIELSKFRRLMGYQGYADEYINDVIRTMFREPSYRELTLLAEDEAATTAWLEDKCKRAGYEAIDAKLMTKALYKRSMMTQRSSYYSQAFYMYREGYIDQGRFRELLARLDLRPEAISLSVAAADLAFTYDYIKDAVTYYRNSYLKDLISDDELLISFVSLGVVPRRAAMLVRLAKVQKIPKPRKDVKKEVAAALTKVQVKYIQLYTVEYRQGFIDEVMFLTDLLALGITPDLAEVTVALEVAKAVPAA